MATVKITSKMVADAIQDVDWAAVDAMTDEDITDQVASNPDAAPLLTDAETVSAMVKTLRSRLHLSQPEFAQRYNIPIGTLQDWEQARKRPDATALAYLRVISSAPDTVAQVFAVA